MEPYSVGPTYRGLKVVEKRLRMRSTQTLYAGELYKDIIFHKTVQKLNVLHFMPPRIFLPLASPTVCLVYTSYQNS